MNVMIEYTMVQKSHLRSMYTIIQCRIVLILLLLTFHISNVICDVTGNCSMEVWVYTDNKCSALQPPNAVGLLYSDGQCHEQKIDSIMQNEDSIYLPGTYRAQCTADGKYVRFIESGCDYDDCSSSTVGADFCQSDRTIPASLYAGNDAAYPVQKKQDATSSSLFKCTTLNTTNGEISLTFVIFGDCSDPSCPRMTDENDDSNAYDDDGVEPLTPVVIEGTRAPVSSPNSPIDFIDKPTSSPTKVPSESSSSFRDDSVRVSMLLSEVTGYLSNDASDAWEGVTAEHIKESVMKEGYGIASIKVEQIEEQYLESTQIVDYDTVATLPPRNSTTRYRTRHRRSLASSINISSDVTISFGEGAMSNVSAKDVFHAAFDTETERTRYIIKLVSTGLPAFAKVNRLVIPDDGLGNGTFTPGPGGDNSNNNTNNNNTPPTPTKPSNQTSGSDPSAVVTETGTTASSGMGVVIGAAVGAGVLLVGVGYYMYSRGKKDILRHKEDDPQTDNELSPSSAGMSSDYYRQMQLMEQKRWTNEIIVDPSNDDVSTLGGDTLAELQVMSGVANGPRNALPADDDEVTASVNVDYDFVKQRYRTGASANEEATVDRSFADQTNATSYTNYSKLGLGTNADASMFEDDKSFEQQYAATDDDMDDITNYNMLSGINPTPLPNQISNERVLVNGKSNLQCFDVRVPPGLLGMVVDTPGGSTPIVRAVKGNSVLFGQVSVGDMLLSVDHVDVTHMSAMQVCNIISARSHLPRVLGFAKAMK